MGLGASGNDIYVNARPIPVDPNAIATTIPAGISLAPKSSDLLQQVLDAAGPGKAAAPVQKSSDILQQAIENAKAPAKAPPPATVGSVVANIPAGINEQTANLLGLPGDISSGIVNLGIRGVNALTGSNIPTPPSLIGSEAIKGAMGAANPENVPANNLAEKIARGLGGGAAAATEPWAALGMAGEAGLSGAAALYPRAAQFFQGLFGTGAGPAQAATQAVIGASGGAAGNAAANFVPDRYKPIAQFVGNIAGGVPAAIGTEVPTLAQAAVHAAQDYAAPMWSQSAKEALAAKLFASGVQDRQTALQTLQQGSGTGIGGIPQTTYQATGDSGIGAAERAAETVEPGPFNERRAVQNEARVGVLQRLQPTGNPAAVSAHIRDQLSQLDDLTAGIERQATVGAQGKASAIGGNATPEAVGAEARRHLAQANMGAKAWEKALWDAVDPEGKLALGAAPITAGARRIEGEIAKSAKPMEGEEGKIFEAAKGLDAVSSLKEITALRSRISEEMRNQRGPQGSAQALARLTQLRGVVEQAIMDAAEHKAGQEGAAVQSGQIGPGVTLAERLADFRASFEHMVAESGRASARRGSAETGPAPTGLYGTEGPAGSGFRGVKGTQGVPARSPTFGAKQPETVRAQSLFSFLKDKGGLKDSGGELRARDLDRVPGLVNNKNGMTLDHAREVAAEAGYFGHDRMSDMANSSIDDLLDLLGDARQRYSTLDWQEVERARAASQGNEHVDRLRAAVAHISQFAEKNDLELSTKDLARAAEHYVDNGGDPDAAVERVFLEDHAEEQAQNGVSSFPRRLVAPPEQAPLLNPNLDTEAGRRIKEASAATKERAQTFKQGPVGEALAEKGTKDDFKILDSGVGAQFWKGGPSGADGVRSYLKAVGNASAAVETLSNIAALSLRRAAMREDGTLDPTKFQGWTVKHQDALRVLDGVSKVSGSFADSARASEAIASATAMRKAALDAYQRGALKPFLAPSEDADVTRNIGKIFEQPNRISIMRQLAGQVAGNPDAKDGLRKGIADYINSQFVGNTEQAKSDAFQTFMRQNRPVLAQVFDKDELKGMDAVAAELSLIRRREEMKALPARSTTAQDVIKSIQKIASTAPKQSLLAEMVEAGFGAGKVGEHFGLGGLGQAIGVGAAIAKNRLNAMRAAGMKDVQSLVREMLLNPQLAREALEKVGPEKTMSRDIKLTQQFNRVAAIAAMRAVNQRQNEKRAQ